MHRKRSTMIVVVFVAAVVGLSAWLLGAATGPAAGQARSHHAARVTVVNVTIGKPAELGFTLSKFSALPAGTITFKVTNAGGLSHDFKVCSVPTIASLNACAGKGTPMLAPGKSATLTLTLTKKGQYEYLCTVAGHAHAGMKGVFGVGVKIKGGTSVGGVSTAGGGSSSYSNLKPCASPVSTTVQVSMFEYSYTLSPGTFPCGTVTFVMKNTGTIEHNFNVLGVQGGGAGNVIGQGETTTKSMTLGPGGYSYQCDVEGHLAQGMVGTFTVTG